AHAARAGAEFVRIGGAAVALSHPEQWRCRVVARAPESALCGAGRWHARAAGARLQPLAPGARPAVAVGPYAGSVASGPGARLAGAKHSGGVCVAAHARSQELSLMRAVLREAALQQLRGAELVLDPGRYVALSNEAGALAELVALLTGCAA